MLSKYTTIKSLLDSIFIISAVNIAIGYIMTKTEYIPSMEVWFTKENLFLLIFYKIKGALKKKKTRMILTLDTEKRVNTI